MFSDRSGPEGTREMFVELRLTLVEEADEKDLNGGCGLSIKEDCSCGWGVLKSDQRGVIDGCAENSMFSRRLSLLGYRRRGGSCGAQLCVHENRKKKKRWERKIRGEKVHDPYARHI